MKRTAKQDLEHWEHLYKHRHYQDNFYPNQRFSSDELFNILNTLGTFKVGNYYTHPTVPREVMRDALDILRMVVE